MLHSFFDELEKIAEVHTNKEAGIKDIAKGLVNISKKAKNTLENGSIKAINKVPHGPRIYRELIDPINTTDISHAIGNISRMLGH